jgi:hypothetical protein
MLLADVNNVIENLPLYIGLRKYLVKPTEIYKLKGLLFIIIKMEMGLVPCGLPFQLFKKELICVIIFMKMMDLLQKKNWTNL